MTLERPIRVAIIGSGISGIAQAIRLKQDLGRRAEVTIYERASRAGGIWRDSVWPDAGVDTDIHLYALYSDLNPQWSSVYASQPEVLAFWEGLIDKHDLRSSIQYNSSYISSTWLEAEQAHAIIFADPSGKETFDVVADIIISATGPLAKHIVPQIPGLPTFTGDSFHNLDWDNSVKLEGKRIAVLGSGSSGIQLVPGVAAVPGVHLTHFIRSGGYFIEKINVEFSRKAKWAFTYIPGAQRLYRNKLFWDAYFGARKLKDPASREKQGQKLLQYAKEAAPAEYIEALTPNYPYGCKRVAREAGWFKALHRENVELVKNEIVRVSEGGLHTSDGRYFPVDVIIFATGSDVARYGLGLSDGLKGQDGLDLGQFYDSLGGPEAYLGIAVPQFPNYFVTLGPNANAASWGWTSGNQTAVISRIIKELVDSGLSSIQPTIEAFEEHNRKVQEGLKGSVVASGLCHNYNTIGKKVTLSNYVSSVGLWRQSRKTRWSDWTGTKRDKATNQLQTVNLHRQFLRQRLVLASVLLLLLGAVLSLLWVLDVFGGLLA